jgi:hypothetical protein
MWRFPTERPDGVSLGATQASDRRTFGGRMSIEKTFNVIFPLRIVPKKLLLSNCIRRQIPLHFERRYSTLPVFFECEGIAGYMLFVLVTTQVSYRLVEKLKNVYGKGVTILFRAKQTLSDNAACRGYSA